MCDDKGDLTPSKKTEMYILPSNFAVVQICSVPVLVSVLAQAKYVTPVAFKCR